ncbi:MAG TPA: IS110 family transposase [Blastocatellia bacterium]
MKKLMRKPVRFKGLSVGLDVHQEFIEYCVLDRNGDQVDAGRIASSQDTLRAFIARLKKREKLQVSLEACRCFIWIFDLLISELDRDVVHVAQPSRLHVISNSMEKNDANDAWWLAYLMFEGRLPESFVAEGTLRDLRIASRELRSYTDLRGDLLRRFRSHMAQAGVKVRKNWHTSKIGRKKMSKILTSIKGERRRALQMLKKQIKTLSTQLKLWQARVKELSKSFPEVQTMIDNLPGFGTITAGVTMAELGSPQRFRNQRAYAKATGLTPGYRQSGGKNNATAITRQGSRHVRWAFTRSIICCLRCKGGLGAQIKAWVENQSKNKRKKKVVVAAARKMAEGVWRLFSLGEAFDLAKAFPVKLAATG